MAQVFDRGLVLALKLTAVIAVVLIVAGFYLWRWAINYPYQVGAPPPQPLPFSHCIMSVRTASIAATAIPR